MQNHQIKQTTMVQPQNKENAQEKNRGYTTKQNEPIS
jgi:hypothetical protein